MKKLTLFTRLSVVLAIAVGTHLTLASAAQTNAVQFINLQLIFLTQGPTVTNSPATNDITATAIKTAVGTKDVIAWLGEATAATFPATSKLVRVTHFNSSGDTTTYEVRFGTNSSVDVSQFFANSTSSEQIDQATYNLVTGLTVGKTFENLHLVFTNTTPYSLIPYFHVSGSATVNYVSAKSGKTILTADQVVAPDLSGNGSGTNGVHALVTGSITITGTKTEVK